jgi:hypothetical protein
VSQKTLQTYTQAREALLKFQQLLGYSESTTLTEGMLAEFIAWLSLLGKAAATISLYVAGLSFWQKLQFGEDPTASPSIRQLMKGVRRDKHNVDDRQPITGETLAIMIRSLPAITSSSYEATLIEAAFSLSFFGFLRLSDFTCSSKRNNETVSLLARDIRLEGHTVVISLRHSKSNQSGRPQIIKLAKSLKDTACPVRAVSKYMAIRPS